MNYQKLDGQLVTECENAGGVKQLAVFVRTRVPLPEEALHDLKRLRVSKPDPAQAVFPMELSAGEVADLSDRPWVISIRSSRKLRPLS
jgi:hypothetical protein